MLPRYIAFQRYDFNYYIIYESVHLTANINRNTYRLVPIRPNNFVIKKYENTQNDGVIPGEFKVRKTTRTSPNYRDEPFNPIKTGYEFTIKIISCEFKVPIVNCPEEQQQFCLGKRFDKTDSVYFVSWCPSETEIETIREVFHCDNIISYNRSGRVRSVVPVQVSIPTPVTIPTYILNGWIENACRTEMCPIMMCPLTIETVCSTPCYHLISYDAAVAWINEKHNCPVCRGDCEIAMLHRC